MCGTLEARDWIKKWVDMALSYFVARFIKVLNSIRYKLTAVYLINPLTLV